MINSPSYDPLNMMDTITPIPEVANSNYGSSLEKQLTIQQIQKNKRRDLNFGFEILKLDQNIAEKATRLMESEF